MDAESKTVTIKGAKTLNITVNSNEAQIDGKNAELDVPAAIKNDRVYVPLRFAAEGLNVPIEWDAETKTVIIGTQNSNAENTKGGKICKQ